MKRLINLFRRGSPRLYLSNTAGVAGTHGDGCVTRRSDAAQPLRNALVKIGSDADHVAVTTAGTENPLGVCNDEATAAEQYVNICLLGQKPGTVIMSAHAAIAAGDMLVAAADGRVQTLPATSGTYYVVGRALNAAAAQDDDVEVAHTLPYPVVVS